jgi:hypothetical protein
MISVQVREGWSLGGGRGGCTVMWLCHFALEGGPGEAHIALSCLLCCVVLAFARNLLIMAWCHPLLHTTCCIPLAWLRPHGRLFAAATNCFT